MNDITFKQLYRPGKVVMENERFIHYHTRDMLLLYDCNYIQFKQMPSVQEFIVTEDYLRTFHFQFKQKHVKFCFPDNEPLTSELVGYLSQADYGNCLLELYGIEPRHFPVIAEAPEITIQSVTMQYFESYLTFQYRLDVMYGAAYAEQKQQQYKRNFRSGHVLQLSAYYKGILAGSVDVILSDNMAELDSLIVLPMFRQKGIATRLQQYVMKKNTDKIIILAADGYDTAKEMYQKLHYHYLGFRYEVLKIFP
nr:GNAT family N-acetyltransferase [uncultured Bacillus sp.]